MLVIDQFEKAVEDYPNNIAIKTEDGRQITYSNLNHVANDIGRILYQIFQSINNDIKSPLVCVMFDRDIGTTTIVVIIIIIVTTTITITTQTIIITITTIIIIIYYYYHHHDYHDYHHSYHHYHYHHHYHHHQDSLHQY